MIAYKLTTIRNASVYTSNTLGLIHYCPGKKVGPNSNMEALGYYPTVFDTRENVRFFMGSDELYGLRLWKVQTGRRMKLLPYLTLHNTLQLLRGTPLNDLSIDETWPQGTVMVEWVKLLEEVE